ncbi:MAG TPA: N-acetyl-gamma-glutamyl-phosphate reductase [Chloroflexota bacterium]|nr:N-acetyl-gamma-glutamyl-phosphate reductase [Chloroflexota bacterium]
MSSRKRVGVVGVSGYGGGEILRLCANHPAVEVVYAAGETSAGQRLGSRYPGLGGQVADLTIQAFNTAALPDNLDLLFMSLPTGDSKKAATQIQADVKIIDVGGDHRFVDGWTYGLTEIIGPSVIAESSRVADPGCFPAATLLALAPLLKQGLIESTHIIVDAKTGISGAGRGGGSTFGFAEVNEDVAAYNLFKHAHTPEMREAVALLSANPAASLVFSPHLVPMTRGILATCYARGRITTGDALQAAREFYAESAFVRVSETLPHSKWAQGSNLAFVSYAADPEQETVIALGAIDNLGKGAAGQAVQNMNLMLGCPEQLGLDLVPMLP